MKRHVTRMITGVHTLLHIPSNQTPKQQRIRQNRQRGNTGRGAAEFRRVQEAAPWRSKQGRLSLGHLLKKMHHLSPLPPAPISYTITRYNSSKVAFLIRYQIQTLFVVSHPQPPDPKPSHPNARPIKRKGP